MLVDLFEYPTICKNRFILLWTPVAKARQLFYKLKTVFKKKYSIYTFSKKIPKRYTFPRRYQIAVSLFANLIPGHNSG